MKSTTGKVFPRGLVYRYDRGLQNLWKGFDSLTPCKKTVTCKACGFFLHIGNRTARPKHEVLRESPSGAFESKLGLKGGKAAGGIPLPPVKKQLHAKRVAVFLHIGNRTARPKHEVLRESPSGAFESKLGLKGGKGAGGIPLPPVKKQLHAKHVAVFFA